MRIFTHKYVIVIWMLSIADPSYVNASKQWKTVDQAQIVINVQRTRH